MRKSLFKVLIPFFLIFVFSIQESSCQSIEAGELRKIIHFTESDVSLNLSNLEIGEEYRLLINGEKKESFNIVPLIPIQESRIEEGEFFFIANASQIELFIYGLEDDYYYVSLSSLANNFPTNSFPLEPLEVNNIPIITGGIIVDEQLIRDVFIGGNCYDVENVNVYGSSPSSFGTFENGSVALGFEEGLIMSTGFATSAGGNNSASSTTGATSGFTSNPFLSQILDELGTYDQQRDLCIIEFNFTPTVATLSFDFIFASEEYCEWEDSGYNDVFGFFIEGPGISGGFAGGAQDLAFVPGTGDFITINTINHVVNSSYYVNNYHAGSADASCLGYPTSEGASASYITFDGMTTILTATAEMIPCETYKITLAIVDVGDNAYDSAIFLKGKSFNDSPFSLEAGSLTPGGGLTLYEGCEDGYLKFTRIGGDPNSDLIINYTISSDGTAENGVDYEPISSTVTIPAGQNEVYVFITTIADFIAEGVESIIIHAEQACTCSSIDTELFIEDLPELNASMDDMTLCGNASISLTPDVTGGVGDYYYYLWDTGAGASTINPWISESTSYTVTVYDECNQEDTATIDITVLENPTANLEGEGYICGAGVVELQVNLTGDAPWEIGYSQNGQSYFETNIMDSVYTIQTTEPGVVSLNSVTSGVCPGFADGQIEVLISDMTVDPIIVDLQCSYDTTGQIFLDVENGALPYSYNWSTENGVDSFAYNLSPDTYSVSITDSLGCVYTDSYTVEGPTEIITEIVDILDVDCLDTLGSVSINVEGGTPGYNYLWTGGYTTQNLTNVPPGNYQLTITDENSCEKLLDVEIINNVTQIVADAGETDTLKCNKTEVTLGSNLSSSGSNIIYNWYSDNGSFITSTNSNTTNVNSPGIYFLEVLDTVNYCYKIDTVLVGIDTLSPTPIVSNYLDLTCTNIVVGINSEVPVSSGQLQYNWSTNDGNIVSSDNIQDIIVDSSGTYTLVVTDFSNYCKDTIDIFVNRNINYPITDILEADTITCTELTVPVDVNITNSNIYTTSWTTNDGNILNAGNNQAVVAEGGLYLLEVVDSVTGCVTYDSIMVFESQDKPVFSLSTNDTITCSDTFALVDVSIDDIPSFSYQWTDENGDIITSSNPLNFEVYSNGLFELRVENQDNGCWDTSFIFVPIDTIQPLISLDNVLLDCSGSVGIDAQVNSAHGSLEYEWYDSNDELISSDISTVVSDTGNYNFYVVDLINGCSNTKTLSVLPNMNYPVLSIDNPPILNCSDEQIEIQSYVELFSGTDNYTANWSTQNGFIVSGNNSLTPTVAKPGEYFLNVVDNDNHCPKDISVIVNEAPDFLNVDIAPKNPTCDGGNGYISVPEIQGGTPPYIYSIDGGEEFVPQDSFYNLSAGSYSIIIEDVYGCQWVEPFELNYPIVTEVSLPEVLQLQLNEDNIIQTVLNVPDYFIDSVFWTPSDGLSNDQILRPHVSSVVSGYYTIHIRDLDGCYTEANLYVRVVLDKNVYVPTAFSPNSDGINDNFTVFAKTEMVKKINKLLIYDRWGELVFKNEDFYPNNPSDGWDGSLNGKPLNPGVFVYWCELEYIDGTTILLKGDVTLLR